MASAVLQKINDVIKGKAPLSAKRSPEWPKVRAEHLKNNPCCAVCGGNKKLEVHHITPFHIDKSLELDANNLITLCESASDGVICHLFVGHKGNYKESNPNVVQDSKTFKEFLSK